MEDTMKKLWGCLAIIVIVALIIGAYAVKINNGMVAEKQNVNKKWSDVEGAYQRRLDLIPNLVATVKGYAAHESQVLEAVTASRSQVGSIRLTPEMLKNPAELKKFEQAQEGLKNAMSSALSRLLVVAEKYPDLKANQNFMALSEEITGSENRVNAARKHFNDAVQTYNTMIAQFPASIFARLFGYQEKDYFKSTAGSDKAPVVDFGK
jgi:LemA protein